MLAFVIALYVIGGGLSIAGIVHGYAVTLKPARLYKRAKAIRDRVDVEWRERASKADTPREFNDALNWKDQQMRSPMGEGRTVESVLQGPFLGGLTREELAYYANKDSTWDVLLVGLGTFVATVASVLSLNL